MQARRTMRAAMVVALGAAAELPALTATAGPASARALGPDPALSGTPDPSWWGTGGTQVDIARYAVFDQVNGNLLPDRVQLDSPMGVWSFAAVPGGLLIGGDFTFVNATTNVHQGLAFLPGTP